MCNIFSFNYHVDEHKVFALLGEDRRQAVLKGENPDSHAYIAEFYSHSEDRCAKYEIGGNIDRLREIAKRGVRLEDLTHDGGIPEEELKSSDFREISRWLNNIDFEIEVIQPMMTNKFPHYLPFYDSFKQRFEQNKNDRAVFICRIQKSLINRIYNDTNPKKSAKFLTATISDIDCFNKIHLMLDSLLFADDDSSSDLIVVAIIYSVTKYAEDDSVKNKLRIVISPAEVTY